MKRFAILAVTFLALSLGLGVSLLRSQNPQELDGIAKARVDAAKETYVHALGQLQTSHRTGGPPPVEGSALDEVYRWSCRWLEAERDWKTEKTVALKAHLERMKELEGTLPATPLRGRETRAAYEKSAVKFYRLEAELWLAKVEKLGK